MILIFVTKPLLQMLLKISIFFLWTFPLYHDVFMYLCLCIDVFQCMYYVFCAHLCLMYSWCISILLHWINLPCYVSIYIVTIALCVLCSKSVYCTKAVLHRNIPKIIAQSTERHIKNGFFCYGLDKKVHTVGRDSRLPPKVCLNWPRNGDW